MARKLELSCFDEKKGGFIKAGSIEGNDFIKYVRPSKHLIRKYNAYAIQESIVISIFNSDVRTLYFVEPERVLKCSISKFMHFSFVEDLGHGPQYIIAISHFSVVNEAQEKINFKKRKKVLQKK